MGDSGVLVQNPLQAMMGVDGGKAMGGKEVPSSKPKAVLESAKSMTGKLVEKIDLTKTTILDAKSDLSQMHVPKPNAHGQSMVSERVKERQDAKSGKRPLTRSLSSRKAFREQHLSSHVALDLSLVMMGIHGILVRNPPPKVHPSHTARGNAPIEAVAAFGSVGLACFLLHLLCVCIQLAWAV